MDVDSVATDIARLLAEWIGPDGEARAEAKRRLDKYGWTPEPEW